MAKAKRRVKRTTSASDGGSSSQAWSGSAPSQRKPDGATRDDHGWLVWSRRAAAALLGGLIVYLAYYPSDSIQVETGDALWFCALALILWTITLATEPLVRRRRPSENRARSGEATSTRLNLHSMRSSFGAGLPLDALVGCLAIWMMVSALSMCPPGNLRQATNEAWLWIAAAGVFTAARRLLADRATCASVLSLLGAIAAGMAVMALHQEWISLPQTRAEYLSDPDRVLQAAGIDAPRGSAQRMVFANRLLDGGPTGTFALANSLAGLLLVAVIVPVGLLSDRRDRPQPKWVSIMLVTLIVVGVAALIACRSRSALGACLVGCVCTWLMGRRGSSTGRRKEIGVVLLGAGIVLAGVLGGILLLGDPEWMAAAPASLQFRLQYWKSTVALLSDHPLMGAGPGGFQAMYLQYRLPVANETISDPHNFFFETLAAGGLPAGLLLTLIALACFLFRKRDPVDTMGAPPQAKTTNTLQVASWLGHGALLSLVLIWLLSMVAMQTPDVGSSIFAVPVAIASGFLFHWVLKQTPSVCQRRIASGILAGIMIHLLVSGGWTVPGVALVVWLSTAMLCPVDATLKQDSERQNTEKQDGDAEPGQDAAEGNPFGSAEPDEAFGRHSKTLALATLGVGAALLVCLKLESIDPTQQAHVALLRADDALRRGRASQSDAESRRGVEADPWGFEAARWRSELLRSRIVGERDDKQTRSQWQRAMETTLQRAGENPLLIRAVAEQCLHVYQVSGKQADLDQAATLIDDALRLNPTDVSLVAQAAMIASQLGDRERALDLAERAQRLSKLGGNVVRKLSLQQILVVRPLGVSASRRPVSRAVSDEFRDQLGIAGEPE